jgi:outer membrane protein TolC
MFEGRSPALLAHVALAALLGVAPLSAQTGAPLERVTFREAVRRATERNPSVGEAAQAILRAEGLLEGAKSVFKPTLYGDVSTTILDAARGFGGNITQPRTQYSFNGTVTYPFLAAERWARKNQVADQVEIAKISAEETRRQVALTAAQAYLAVLTAERNREIAVRTRDTALALADYARARLDAGQGSRLNHVRSSQELAAAEGLIHVAELAVQQAQEALGIATFSEGPLEASGDPDIAPPVPASDHDAWLIQRPDVRLFTAQLQAADRVVRDHWKSWVPQGTAYFTPQYVTPAGFFAPAKTWQAFFQLQIPVFDSTIGATKRVQLADRATAQIRLDAVNLEARSEVRLAQESVARNLQIVAAIRESAANAIEALRISEIAYKAGATTNIEVVQAQQTARNAELAASLAEDRLRQAQLDLVVALGQFP